MRAKLEKDGLWANNQRRVRRDNINAAVQSISEFEKNALVMRRTVLHDLSVLAIRRTMQINSRPTAIIVYFWKQSGDFRDVRSFISTIQTAYESYGYLKELGLGSGFVRLLSCV